MKSSLPAYARNIKRLREARGWSQQELAQRSKRSDGKPLSVATVSNLERAAFEPEMPTLDAVAAGLGQLTADLLREPRKRPARKT